MELGSSGMEVSDLLLEHKVSSPMESLMLCKGGVI